MSDIERELNEMKRIRQDLSKRLDEANNVLSELDAKITSLLERQEARMAADGIDSKIIGQIHSISAKDAVLPAVKSDEKPIRLVAEPLSLEQITVIPRRQSNADD